MTYQSVDRPADIHNQSTVLRAMYIASLKRPSSTGTETVSLCKLNRLTDVHCDQLKYDFGTHFATACRIRSMMRTLE